MNKKQIENEVRKIVAILDSCFPGQQRYDISSRLYLSDVIDDFSLIKENISVSDKQILDIGCGKGHWTALLSKFLKRRIEGIDLRECPIRCPGVISLVGDIRKTDFKDGYFDRIVSISTIEHLGIETRYGSYADINADRKALLEMKRILKDNGKIILTVPFGKAGINSVQRTYDLRGIKKLTRGFKILKMEFAKDFGGNWSYASIDEVKGTVGCHANVLVSLSK